MGHQSDVSTPLHSSSLLFGYSIRYKRSIISPEGSWEGSGSSLLRRISSHEVFGCSPSAPRISAQYVYSNAALFQYMDCMRRQELWEATDQSTRSPSFCKLVLQKYGVALRSRKMLGLLQILMYLESWVIRPTFLLTIRRPTWSPSTSQKFKIRLKRDR